MTRLLRVYFAILIVALISAAIFRNELVELISLQVQTSIFILAPILGFFAFILYTFEDSPDPEEFRDLGKRIREPVSGVINLMVSLVLLSAVFLLLLSVIIQVSN